MKSAKTLWLCGCLILLPNLLFAMRPRYKPPTDQGEEKNDVIKLLDEDARLPKLIDQIVIGSSTEAKKEHSIWGPEIVKETEYIGAGTVHDRFGNRCVDKGDVIAVTVNGKRIFGKYLGPSREDKPEKVQVLVSENPNDIRLYAPKDIGIFKQTTEPCIKIRN